jgi:hypothetical protein
MEAKMSLQSRRELLFRIKNRYQQGGKKEKTDILNGFVHATGYGRKHAISVLSAVGKDEKIIPVLRQRERRPKYGDDVRQSLLTVWNAANQICSKRLVPFLPEFVETLERFGHICLQSDTKAKLLSLSPRLDKLLWILRDTDSTAIA